jgi:hypothetical protein
VTPEPANVDGGVCAGGGQKIEVGVDMNDNGVLDSGEVDSTSFVCDGQNSLTKVTPVAPNPDGGPCAAGGQKIEVGLDENNNGVLDPDEVASTSYVCNGHNSLSKVTAVAPSPDGGCANGGQKIEVGVDTNDNGVLDSAEVASTTFVCDGQSSLTKVTAVPADPDGGCATGGQKIEVGQDTNGDHILEDSEVTSTSFVCNGSCFGNQAPTFLVPLASLSGTAPYNVGDPIIVTIHASDPDTAILSYEVFGSDFTILPGDTAEEFVLTPRAEGGPFYFGVLVSDGCSVAAGTFSIESTVFAPDGGADAGP